ncbi:n-acetylglutamate synthase [Ulvibacterium sp.]|uniref:n-acetylglutamate synthase n=1 Tax=Ulvibacterium sp. TaxID=2665914 RepID=UPI00263945E9|nr:n-acetylglutamate synthase [Ulvibacterium sp.]
MNYHNKKFRPITNTSNGEVSEDLVFEYQQKGNVVTCRYQNSTIVIGHLLGLVDSEGNIDMRYHQVNTQGKLMTGICTSSPELMENGKIRLYENWVWTSGDKSKGNSVLEEL